MRKYDRFLENKTQMGAMDGFNPIWIPDFLFEFQKVLVEWAVKSGRCAIFADCGLGKTPMQLVWSENIVRKENKPVLILTPIAVSHQTMTEAEKFSIDAHRSKGRVHAGINITNYEQLHHFDPSDFAGVVCDESSILKSFDGVRRKMITEFMRVIKYRLLCTATAAPNDYIELGTSSEALGYLGFMDMLNRFFKNDQNNSQLHNKFAAQGGVAPKWRFKGHAERMFWRWVCSWARAIRKPSDLGFDNDGFILPPLNEIHHIVKANRNAPGMLFSVPAAGLRELREERRRTINERCEKVSELASGNGHQTIIWCHLNKEADLIEHLIPESKQVSGKDSDDSKEEKLISFTRGDLKVLITKPKIGAWGLNFQQCQHTTFFPSYSFEQYYQCIRRLWRFGQKSEVRVDIVATEGEKNVMLNLKRKSELADKMFSHLMSYMTNELSIDRREQFVSKERCPSWL